MYVKRMVSSWWLSNGLYLFFSATLKLRQYSEKHQFRFYMVYGWGLSAILTLILPVLDYTEPFPSYLLPEVDINTCFLRSMYKYQIIVNIFFRFFVVLITTHSVLFFLSLFLTLQRNHYWCISMRRYLLYLAWISSVLHRQQWKFVKFNVIW